MKTAVVECSFGILAFNEENKLIEKVLFPKKPQEAAKTLVKIEAGKMVDEIAELVNRLRKNGYETFVFENASLANEVQKKFGVKVEVSKPSEAGEMLRFSMERFAVETGFVKDAEEFTLWTHNVPWKWLSYGLKELLRKET